MTKAFQPSTTSRQSRGGRHSLGKSFLHKWKERGPKGGVQSGEKKNETKAYVRLVKAEEGGKECQIAKIWLEKKELLEKG